MRHELTEALHKWDAQVEAEAVRLINEGMPPYDAMEQARENVTKRRRVATEQGREKK